MSKGRSSIPYVGLWDLHGGYDRIYRGGKYITQRTDNQKALKTALQFIADFQPAAIILGGDMVNGGCISHWNEKNPRTTEGFRLKDEFDIVRKTLLEPLYNLLPDSTRKIWIQGNHERFVDDFFLKHPGFEGLFGVAKDLQLTENGWEFYDHGELARIGKCFYGHGEKLGGQYHAAKALAVYQRNIRYGHHHTAQAATGVSAVDRKDFHDAKSVPCLAQRNPGYAQNQPNRWVNGLLFGEALKSGEFTDFVVTMVNNKFILNGKVYGT